jgi:hypothetical protein
MAHLPHANPAGSISEDIGGVNVALWPFALIATGQMNGRLAAGERTLMLRCSM